MDERTRQIKQIRDSVSDGSIVHLGPDLMEEALAVLRSSRIELMSIPSESPGVAENPGAGPKQLDFVDAFLAHKHRVYAAYGANRSGKTVAIAEMCFCRHLRDYARDGDRYWVIYPSVDTGRDVPSRALWNSLPRSMFPNDLVYSPRMGFGQIPTLHLNLPGDRGKCEIWFKSEEQELQKFESSNVHGIWWTEAEREAIYGAIFPRMADNRAWLLLDYVPTQAWHLERIKSPFESGADPSIYCVQFAMIDNGHNLPSGEIEYQRSKMSDEEARVRIDGEDRPAFGVVYKEFDWEHHVFEPFPIPASWTRFRSLDYGYRNPTAVIFAAICPAGEDAPGIGKSTADRLIVYREYYEKERTVTQIAAAVNQLSANEDFFDAVIIDPSAYNVNQANGHSIAWEFEAAGLLCSPGIRSSSVGEHALVAKVRKWFEDDRLFFSKNCPATIHEHRTWRYRENKDRVAPGAEPFSDTNNHTCDALKELIATDPAADSGSCTVLDHEQLHGQERKPYITSEGEIFYA